MFNYPVMRYINIQAHSNNITVIPSGMFNYPSAIAAYTIKFLPLLMARLDFPNAINAWFLLGCNKITAVPARILQDDTAFKMIKLVLFIYSIENVVSII